MKLNIICLYEDLITGNHKLSQTAVIIDSDFTPELQETTDIQLKNIDAETPIINHHSSILHHPVLSKIPNLKIVSESFDMWVTVKTFSNQLRTMSNIFLSKSTSQNTKILTDGILFGVSPKIFFTDIEGRSFKVYDLHSALISPGSFVINTTGTPVPGTIPITKDLGFKLMTYMQQVTHPWCLPPIINHVKRSTLLPKLIALFSKTPEEIVTFILSLSDNISIRELLVALDNTAYYQEYTELRLEIRRRVQALSYPTETDVMLVGIPEQQLKLANHIILLEASSLKDLNNNLKL